MAAGSYSPSWLAWRLTEFLTGNIVWKYFLGASVLFWVKFDRVDGKVMVRLSEGSLVVRTQQNESVWTSEICKCDLINTRHHYLMMRRLKPTRHTCSKWLTDDASGKRDTRDWLLIDNDDAYTIVDVTLCVSMTYTFIVNKKNTHEANTFSITRTMVASMTLT